MLNAAMNDAALWIAASATPEATRDRAYAAYVLLVEGLRKPD